MYIIFFVDNILEKQYDEKNRKFGIGGAELGREDEEGTASFFFLVYLLSCGPIEGFSPDVKCCLFLKHPLITFRVQRR